VARFLRLTTGEVAPSVVKYLLPGESDYVLTIRQHPAVLLPRILLVLLGLAIAVLLTTSVEHGNAALAIWILWTILLLWLGAKVWDWAIRYFVITSQRVMLVQGVLVRRANYVPLNKVTDIEFRRDSAGRLLGYGELEVRTPGQDATLRHIKFLPYPEQIYLEVSGLLFQETGKCPECAMNIPTAARLCPYCRSRIV
jgi:membrane protein YdbS with pleckstrin-like domain